MIAKALISTQWTNGGYRALQVSRIQDYYVDSALDSDSDQWNISIGDFNGELIDVLRRDNEVLVSIIGMGQTVETLHQGFTDEAVLTHEGVLTISGRDISAPAVDSDAPPFKYRNIRPEVFVATQARKLKIGTRLVLKSGSPFKTFVQDGSETYWEGWHRFARRRRMWIWAEPDASIHMGDLNYNIGTPRYFFGTPASRSDGRKWIRVERAEWRVRKDRVGDAYVFGHNGNKPLFAHVADLDIASWIKKSTKIVKSTTAHNDAGARVEALEEIFESKVGALEWRLVVESPGYLIKQNTMATLNLPEIGLSGTFFIVGVRIAGGPDGAFQEVRLRESRFAISKRVPKDPPPISRTDPTGKTAETPTDPTDQATGDLANSLPTQIRWRDFFVSAATKHRGPWSMFMFLSTLISIAWVEHGGSFKNTLSGSAIEWMPFADYVAQHGTGHSGIAEPILEKQYQDMFANDHPLKAVGVMQLYTPSYKLDADRLYNGRIDEFQGGRWRPQFNIEEGAIVLREKLRAAFGGEQGEFTAAKTDENIWRALPLWNSTDPQYSAKVKRAWNNIFQSEVRSALEEVNSEPKTSQLPGNAPTGIEKMIAWADSQRGSEYHWGKAGPYAVGYDCSGLASMAYFKGGYGTSVGVSREWQHGLDTVTWWADGKGYGNFYQIKNESDLLPGDVVFAVGADGTKSAPGHMALYAGDGEVIVARYKGTLIQRQSMADFKSTVYVGALRLRGIWDNTTKFRIAIWHAGAWHWKDTGALVTDGDKIVELGGQWLADHRTTTFSPSEGDTVKVEL